MISDEIRETLKQVCSVLVKHEVDYMIVGGAAVSYYGYQRLSTISKQAREIKVDLDFWYNPTLENFHRLN